MNVEYFYSKLPVFLQKMAINIKGLVLNKRRYDGRYQTIYGEINGLPETLDFQDEALAVGRLCNFLLNCKTEYIRNHMVSQKDIKTLADFTALFPVISKPQIKRCLSLYVSKKYSGAIKSHTSGTSGSGLIFFLSKYSEKYQWAVWWRYRGWHGIKRDTICGYFGGRSIVSLGQSRPPFHRYNAAAYQFMFSAYHLNEETVLSYVDEMERHSIEWLHGYPSVLAHLAALIKRLNLKLKLKVKIITIGAESLLESQKTLIVSVFNCPVRQHYGLAEGVVNISECKNGFLHVDEDFSLVEFLPIDEEYKFRIVGTAWHNLACSFVRYDTGDIATITNAICSCGNRGRVIDEIDGRKEDYVVLPTGVKIGRLDHIFKDLIDIDEAQIVQHSVCDIEILVKKGVNYSDRSEVRLKDEARKRLGKDVSIKITYVGKVPRTSSGKLRLVVSKVK